METLKDLLETWLAWQLGQPHLSEGRKCNSRNEAQHLVSVIGDVVIIRANTTTLEEYQRVGLREGASTGVIRNEISTMIQAWASGGARNLAPGRRLRRPRLKHKARRIDYVPDAVEFWKAVDVVPDDRAWARTMLVLMGATGARPGEIAGPQDGRERRVRRRSGSWRRVGAARPHARGVAPPLTGRPGPSASRR
jgi:hypothetical protein